MVAIPLEQAVREFDRSAVAPLVAAAEQQRQEVVHRFPREEWPTMAIERYAVGLSGHRDTFCRLLEFQTTDLGSIKGGSSRKLIIYKHKDKPGWYFDPSYPDVESAWRAVREAFVEAFSLAEAHDWAGIDELVPLRSGAALRAKAVFSYAPAGLLPIYSREHIAHFRELLTVEDLLEELVGEIYDEFDPDSRAIQRQPDGSLVLPGSFPVHDLPDLGIALPEGPYATVAGLVLARLGRLPDKGETVEIDGWRLEVLTVERRAITHLRLVPLHNPTQDAPA